jgi:regulator of protease activity HflC (stomatin/prohibitin superfamily)
MNTGGMQGLVLGMVCGVALIPLLVAIFKAVTVSVEDEEVVLVTRFGKLVKKLERAGLHVLPERALPWVGTRAVSLRRDYRQFSNVHVNDARGTTVMVDLWLEFKIEDPVKAIFHVADWDRSLQNLVSHAATSILGNREFKHILCDRTELGEILQRDISAETARWGLKIELVFIRNVKLLPEVSRQIYEAIAARLERARADIEEAGRLAVAQLEAETSVKVAALVAEAKGQYPAAVGAAFETLGRDPEVLRAYNTLYALSLVRPHRTVAFRGFGADELRAVDAAMLAPALADGASAQSPAMVSPLQGHDAQVVHASGARKAVTHEG